MDAGGCRPYVVISLFFLPAVKIKTLSSLTGRFYYLKILMMDVCVSVYDIFLLCSTKCDKVAVFLGDFVGIKWVFNWCFWEGIAKSKAKVYEHKALENKK